MGLRIRMTHGCTVGWILTVDLLPELLELLTQSIKYGFFYSRCGYHFIFIHL